jgi:hypothetical protein
MSWDWLISNQDCLDNATRPGTCTPAGGPLMVGGMLLIGVALFFALKWLDGRKQDGR